MLFFQKASHGGLIFSYTVEKYEVMIGSLKQHHQEQPTGQTAHHTAAAAASKNLTHLYMKKIKNNDAYITATFWAFFSIGRFVSIFVAKRLAPSYMILVDIVRVFNQKFKTFSPQ